MATNLLAAWAMSRRLPTDLNEVGEETMYTLWLPVLKICGLFAGFSDTEILTLLPCFAVTSKKYKKGDVVCTAGQPQEHIGIVLAGEIHVQKEDFHGNRPDHRPFRGR